MFSETNRGFHSGLQAQVTKMFIMILVVVIIACAVVIPVINNATEMSGATNETRTILDLLPVFIAVFVIIVVTSIF